MQLRDGKGAYTLLGSRRERYARLTWLMDPRHFSYQDVDLHRHGEGGAAVTHEHVCGEGAHEHGAPVQVAASWRRDGGSA